MEHMGNFFDGLTLIAIVFALSLPFILWNGEPDLMDAIVDYIRKL